MNPENKKQILIITLALGAGIVATVMTAAFVQSRIESERAIMSKQLNMKQQEFVQEQQRGQQQMDALMGEINNLKAQQGQIQQQAIAAAQAAAQATASSNATGAAGKEVEHKSSLALRTPPGKRAITVMIETLSAVGGLLDPGDFVDVIAQLNVPKETSKGKRKEQVTAMLFQHLQVLAINTNMDSKGIYDEQQAASALRITLAVDPEESGFLSFAEKNGKLQLILRSPTEQKNEKFKAPTWKTLAEYILENSGANIGVKVQDEEQDAGDKKGKVEAVPVKEAKPYIQIFRAGREL